MTQGAINSKYGVIGYPVAHSLSPAIHKLFAKQFGLVLDYELLNVQSTSLTESLRAFVAAGGRGLNVTTPYKELLCKAASTLSSAAFVAQAVNMLSFGHNGDIVGENTDGVGLIKDLRLRAKIELKDKTIIILGAGGATRGILGSILTMRPNGVYLVNRDIFKARKVANQFANRGRIHVLDYAGLNSSKLEFNLIINATSAALLHQLPPLSGNLNFQNSYAYDLNYAAKSCLFMRYAQQRGASKIFDGLGMLVEQAAECFYLWHNLRPNTAVVLAQLQASTDQIPEKSVV